MSRACFVYLQMIYAYLHVDSCGNAPIFARESSSFLTQQNLSQLFETLKGLSCDQLRAFRLLSNGIKTPHEFGTIGTIRSRVGCRDGVKTLRESSFKAMAVSDRLGTSCQVKYWLELCEIPPG